MSEKREKVYKTSVYKTSLLEKKHALNKPKSNLYKF